MALLYLANEFSSYSPVYTADIFLPKPTTGTEDGFKERGNTEIVGENKRSDRRNRSMERGRTNVGSSLDRLLEDVPFPFNLAGGLIKVRASRKKLAPASMHRARRSFLGCAFSAVLRCVFFCCIGGAIPVVHIPLRETIQEDYERPDSLSIGLIAYSA